MPRQSPSSAASAALRMTLRRCGSARNDVSSNSHLPPSRCFRRGSSASRAASPIRLMLRIAIDSTRPGQKISDGLIWKIGAALGHDVAPGRRLRADAGAEERQDRFGENGGGADVSALHDQRRDRVRHQMPPHDLRQAGAERRSRLPHRALRAPRAPPSAPAAPRAEFPEW